MADALVWSQGDDVCPDCGMDHSPDPFLLIKMGIDRTHPTVDAALVVQVSVGPAPPEACAGRRQQFLGELTDILAIMAGTMPGRLAQAWGALN